MEIFDAILKAIAKYRNHTSIKAIERVCSSKDSSYFDIMDRGNLKENSLDPAKAFQESDIPTNIKGSAEVFQ